MRRRHEEGDWVTAVSDITAELADSTVRLPAGTEPGSLFASVEG